MGRLSGWIIKATACSGHDVIRGAMGCDLALQSFEHGSIKGAVERHCIRDCGLRLQQAFQCHRFIMLQLVSGHDRSPARNDVLLRSVPGGFVCLWRQPKDFTYRGDRSPLVRLAAWAGPSRPWKNRLAVSVTPMQMSIAQRG